MRRLLLLVMGFVLMFSTTALGKRSHHARRIVTATGCIAEGTECLVLKSTSGTKRYSIGRTDKLQVGHAYRITGRVTSTGICMEGLPILSPQKITEVKLHCPQ